MGKARKSSKDLFSVIYGIQNDFWRPYIYPRPFTVSDYEVINYPVIRGAWLQRQSFLLSGEIVLNGDENSEEFKVIKEYLDNYDDDFVNLISFLHECILWGIAAVEVVYDENTLFPKRYIPIPRYLLSIKEGKIFINDTPLDEIPPQKVVISQNVPTADQPYGFALITILKPLYEIVKEVYNYWGNYIRTFAMPTLVFHIDTSKFIALSDPEKAKIQTEIEKLKNLTTIKNLVISKDLLDYSTIEPKTTNTDAFQKLIEEVHKQMLIAVVGQELTTQAGVSSYALGKVHFEVLKNLIKRDAKIIENAINSQLIPALLELKGIKVQKYPYITFQFKETLTLDDVLKLSQIIPLDVETIKRLTGLDL